MRLLYVCDRTSLRVALELKARNDPQRHKSHEHESCCRTYENIQQTVVDTDIRCRESLSAVRVPTTAKGPLAVKVPFVWKIVLS